MWGWRHKAQEDYKADANMKGLSALGLMRRLNAWCKFNGYTLNPAELQHPNEKRIIRKLAEKTVEMIYSQTKNVINYDNVDDRPF